MEFKPPQSLSPKVYKRLVRSRSSVQAFKQSRERDQIYGRYNTTRLHLTLSIQNKTQTTNNNKLPRVQLETAIEAHGHTIKVPFLESTPLLIVPRLHPRDMAAGRSDPFHILSDPTQGATFTG